jgi:hypothetical protein
MKNIEIEQKENLKAGKINHIYANIYLNNLHIIAFESENHTTLHIHEIKKDTVKTEKIDTTDTDKNPIVCTDITGKSEKGKFIQLCLFH